MGRYPLDPGNIFARIIRGELPAAKVLETEDAVAFLDIRPINFGHVLLIPKGSFATLMDLPDELAAKTSELLPRLCRAVREATGASGINVLVNNGRSAGQIVNHVHWHIIPRFDDDGIKWPWPQKDYTSESMVQMQQRIQERLR